MTSTAPKRPRILPGVAAEWFRYLERTRAADPADYERVEERAWRRLTSNLRAMGEPLDSGGTKR